MAGIDDGEDKESGESFLSRWSRVKARAEPDAASLPEAEPADETTTSYMPTGDGESGEVDLPRLEDILPEGSIARFLGKGIPEALTRAALRQAWTQDPNIRDFIEVAENQYDFNNPTSIYGFGELPADTDIAALLRQATGMGASGDGGTSPTDGAVSDGERLAGESTRISQPLQENAADETVPPALVQEGDRHIMAAGEPEREAVPEAHAPGAAAGPSSLRRHGGALPV